METLTVLIDGQILIEQDLTNMITLDGDEVEDLAVSRHRLAVALHHVMKRVERKDFDTKIAVIAAGDQL